MSDRSEKALSLLNWKLLSELDEAKHKRFEWILKTRESILAGWWEAHDDLRKWRQKVNNEIAQLVAEGQGAAAERLAESLLREPQSYDGPDFEIVVPTGHGLEVWKVIGVPDQALTESVSTSTRHPPPQPGPSSPTKKPGQSEPITADTNGSSLVGFTQPISPTLTPPPTGPPALARRTLGPRGPKAPQAHKSATKLPHRELKSMTKLPPLTKESPAKSSRRHMTQTEWKELVRKRVSTSGLDSWDLDVLRKELANRNIPMGKLRTKVHMQHELARHELMRELRVLVTEGGEVTCKVEDDGEGAYKVEDDGEGAYKVEGDGEGTYKVEDDEEGTGKVEDDEEGTGKVEET